MHFIYTQDFKTVLFRMLQKHSGRRFNLMISGGSLQTCLDDERYKRLDTMHWNIYYTDERVDQGHLNYTASLPFINMLEAKVFRIESSLGMEEAVRRYSGMLNEILGEIDVCMLGIGGDGHICSLLPDTEYLDSDKYVIGIEGNFAVSRERITVTLKFLNEKVNEMYFVVPQNKIKNITEPHPSIGRRLSKDFTVVLNN
jgi:6-phosphogluconolactonase